MKLRWLAVIIIFLGIPLLPACAAGSPSDREAAGAATSTIVNKGSDTIVNLALAWAERYQSEHPNLLISVTGGGTGTGLTALVNGTVDIANASRGISDQEVATMAAAGIEPVEFVVARDAIAIIVHRDNPVNELSLEQISAIFSGQMNNWTEVGGEDRPIVRLSRETNSGTHVYFLEEVLRLGDSENKTLFSTDTLLLPSSEGITAEVRDNPNAVGYEGLGYITPDVKVVAVAEREGSPFVLPSIETVNSGTYPIARDLYMYTAGQPQGVEKDYLDWILSPEAQVIVKELGFVPILRP